MSKNDNNSPTNEITDSPKKGIYYLLKIFYVN